MFCGSKSLLILIPEAKENTAGCIFISLSSGLVYSKTELTPALSCHEGAVKP